MVHAARNGQLDTVKYLVKMVPILMLWIKKEIHCLIMLYFV
ncbi:MAG: hypothetical protein ACR5KV_08170 [Wolbachia sp.]